MNIENLPKKLWQWIDAAEKDALAVADDPAYTFDMEVWHLPDPDQGVTHVCLAGAVMARTLNLPSQYSLGVDALPETVQAPLFALDDFRYLYFRKSLMRLYPDARRVPEGVNAALEELDCEDDGLEPLEGDVEKSDIIKFFAHDTIVRFRALLKQYDL